jgi:hypothetical protein
VNMAYSLHENYVTDSKRTGFLRVGTINRIHDVFSIKMPELIMYMKFLACFGSMGSIEIALLEDRC